MILHLKHYYFLIFLVCCLFLPHVLEAQELWQVPSDKASRVASFKFDSTTICTGEILYNKNCVSCHGNPGRNNNNKALSPLPKDPATPEYQANSDGAIYYKITEGRGLMPSFKNTIEEKDRWMLISYIRSFNPAYLQPVPAVENATKLKGQLKINLVLNLSDHKIEVGLFQKDKETISPLKGFEVTLLAHRYFGYLKLGETQVSDNLGLVNLIYPHDLPGDSAGNVALKIKVINEISGTFFSKDTVFNIGIPSKYKNLLDQRSWWNIRSKAPLWLILSYSATVLGVFGFIFYILLLLYKIWKAGE